jgi:hypothetical protein
LAKKTLAGGKTTQMDGQKSSVTIRHLPSWLTVVAITAVAMTFAVLPAHAGSLEKAKRLYDRLAGVPPTPTVLNEMQLAIDSNGGCGLNASQTGSYGCTPMGAAYYAMTNKAFYNAKLKNWISPWTNRDGNKFAPLNDYTATVIGLIRDGADYRTVLYGDVIYVGKSSVTAPSGNPIAAYSPASNQHYVDLESSDADLGSNQVLDGPFSQTIYTGIPSNATAGVLTTRAAAHAFFIDGTNRAMFRFTMKNHLCNDMEQVQDTTRPTDRIRRDVPRSPGGDSRIFMNTCVGCHSGMDPMAQAFAYYDFHYTGDTDAAKDAGQLVYTAGIVQEKYDINRDHFAEGFITPDDQWDNYWRDGPNTAVLGWGAGTGHGNGAKTMGAELAQSEAFAVCSVKKVFQAVCLRDPASSDQSQFTTLLNSFKSNGYNLKRTFAETGLYCSGN